MVRWFLFDRHGLAPAKDTVDWCGVVIAAVAICVSYAGRAARLSYKGNRRRVANGGHKLYDSTKHHGSAREVLGTQAVDRLFDRGKVRREERHSGAGRRRLGDDSGGKLAD
jgi:hypothetical protein